MPSAPTLPAAPLRPLPRLLAGLGGAALAGLAAAGPAQAAPVFSLSFLPTTSAAEQAAFTQAASIWSSVLADNVTVYLTVGTANIATPGVLANAGSTGVNYSYSTVRNALAADATSANDAIAVANLPAAPALRLLINGTADNPNGYGSLTPYLDANGSANNTTINLNNANARALGLAPSGMVMAACTSVGKGAGQCDGSITFDTTDYQWDLNPLDGITAGMFDFVGIAVHEIGHALGFISGVDVLDTNSPNGSTYYNADEYTFVAPLDLFRCSAASAAQAALDWTASTTDKLFSLDGCNSTMARFSTGVVHGDGRQASHWKDNLGLGALDPTAGTGEAISLTPLDLTAFDVIGWNLASPVSTPAPASALVFALGLAGLGLARRRGLA